MKYDLHTTIWEDIESGAIWLSSPVLTSRTIVRVRNTETNRVVYCEAKMVDEFFLRRYGEQRGEAIEDATQAIFISAWYRKELGIAKREGPVDLDIREAESVFGRIRACLHHPQVVVRIATWLALWSVGLGLIGVALGVLSVIPPKPLPGPDSVTSPASSSQSH